MGRHNKDVKEKIQGILLKVKTIPKTKKKLAASRLGIIRLYYDLRLDYDHPRAPGDIDYPDSFDCNVYYKVVLDLRSPSNGLWKRKKFMQ